MDSQEVFELVNITPKLDEVILKMTTPEFWLFWVKTFGKLKKDQNETEYWEKCGFVFVGWLGATRYINELESTDGNI